MHDDVYRVLKGRTEESKAEDYYFDHQRSSHTLEAVTYDHPEESWWRSDRLA